MDRVFADDGLERAFSDRGFAVVDLFGPEQVETLLELHAATHAGDDEGFWYSVELTAGAAQAAIREGIADIFSAPLEQIAPGHAVISGGFLVKGASGDSTIVGHMDWSVVDETRHRSVNVWVPLCDTTQANGALAVIPGSHRLPLTRRGSGTPPTLAAPRDVVAQHLEVVPMRAGQAILYESRLLHGSATNTSGRPRIALGITMVRAGLDLLHYVGDVAAPQAPLLEVTVDREFFHRTVIDTASGSIRDVRSVIAGRPSSRVPPTPPITAQDLRALAGGNGSGSLGRLWRRSSRRRGR